MSFFKILLKSTPKVPSAKSSVDVSCIELCSGLLKINIDQDLNENIENKLIVEVFSKYSSFIYELYTMCRGQYQFLKIIHFYV